ncbi:S1 family peptidase [Nocardia sp. alder85J]|uniref:S1 family peptidase n=1 Tax=Nocardia sp. alder85J TaxID=2862949 RepID=UPI001CD2A8B4|nr:S1 family peptidase [Nocardia sp. alder85J]MCX4096258.1 S1 family peptidase [Nocardia sp. alder85J]
MRKAAVAASAAALVLGPLAMTASADPAPAPSPAPAPGLPADLAAAVQRDLKMSTDEYLRRAALAQQVAAFSTNAQQQYPDVFGGAWLDNAGKAVVALVPGQGQDAVRQSAQAVGFQVKDVAKTQTALRDEKNAFQQWLTGQPQDVAKSVRGAVIDVVNNTVAVRVDQAGLPMPGFVDPARVIVMAAPPQGPDTLPQATAVAGEGGGPAAAGDAYASQAGHTSLRCSLGFNGVDGNDNAVNITAGHCDPNIPAAGTGDAPGVFDLLPGDHLGPQVGAFEKSVLGAQDYSIVAINDGARDRFSNNLVRVPGQGPIAITGVASPVVGAPVCKSGARTGFSCGVINAVDQTVEVGDHDLMQSFSANICALPGDSGGPVVSGTMALGISSASTVADFPVCEIPELLGVLTGNGPQLFVQPLDLVLADNPGLRVRTN